MVNRRGFLLGMGSVAMASLLSSCKNNYDLNIGLLQGSIPIQLIASLQKQASRLGIVNFQSQSTIEDIYNLLIEWQKAEKKETSPMDLVTLGDYWLKKAIAENLIESLEVEKIGNWDKISPRFQHLVMRDKDGNISNKGKIWGAPYRFGCTMIVYREDKLKGWQPQDWEDLWNPDIKQKISLLDQPREIIGLVLKKLGYSYNTTNLKSIPELSSSLQALHQQVKFYASTNYLQPLILGDTWLAVGWSSDILPVIKNHRNLKAIVPRSGTALWADVWVKPKNNTNSDEQLRKIYNLINFCWETTSVKQINLFTNGISPINFLENKTSKPAFIREEIFAKSDFLEPISSENLEEYYQQLKNL